MISDKDKIDILKNLDIEKAKPLFKQMYFKQAYSDVTGKPVSEDDVILASLHKARLKMPKLFNKEEKDISRKWLYDNNFKVEL